VNLKILPDEAIIPCSEYIIPEKEYPWISGGLRNNVRVNSNGKVALIDAMIGGKVSLDFEIFDNSGLDADYELYVYDVDTGGNRHRTNVTVLEGIDPITLVPDTEIPLVDGKTFLSPDEKSSVPNVLDPESLSSAQKKHAFKVGFKENVVKMNFEVMKRNEKKLNNRRSIFFSIKRVQKAILCEQDDSGKSPNPADLEISCGAGNIEILGAFYGRDDTCTCPYTTDIIWRGNDDCTEDCETATCGEMENTECKEDIVDTISQACDGKASCVVEAKNSLYGDPCIGTYKYVKVNYICS